MPSPTDHEKRDVALGALASAMFLIASVFGILAAVSLHWSDSNDKQFPTGHIGLWRVCDVQSLTSRYCSDIDDQLDVITRSQYERFKAMRVLIILATALTVLAVFAAAMFAAGYKRVPVAGLAALPLTHGSKGAVG